MDLLLIFKHVSHLETHSHRLIVLLNLDIIQMFHAQCK